MKPAPGIPYLVAVNLTRRCNLSCPHCYIDATDRHRADPGALSRTELIDLFRQLAGRAPGTIVVLTGGEPMLHPDLDRLVSAGAGLGLRMVLGTNGLLLTEERAARLKELGLSGVGVSLDSIDAGQHDRFRGAPGAFSKSSRAIQACRAVELHVQVHFTVTRHNIEQLEQAVAQAKSLGASIVNFFFLVCVGKGKHMVDLSPEQYEQALVRIALLQRNSSGVMVQARCAPHFKRILYQQDPDSPYTRATGYDGGGCPAATHYCRVDPTGEVTPCPYMELSAGNIRDRSFWEIWDSSPLFAQFRQPALGGRCGSCEFSLLCGGCRARSLAESGNLWAEDHNCSYLPGGGPVVPVGEECAPPRPVEWTAAARKRLARVPLFLRRRIRRKLEQRAADENGTVTVELMARHRTEREKETGLRFR